MLLGNHQNAEEAFDGTHGGTVQHHRNMLLTPLASALRLSNENKRVGRFASVAAFIKYKFINDLCLNKFAHFCFRSIRLVRYSGRVEKLKGVPHFVSRTIFWGLSTALTLAAHLPEPSLATQVLSLI